MLAHGIHARPAAVLANAAKRFDSEISLVRDGRSVNAKSVVALMSLGVKHAQKVSIRASGHDAEDAVTALAELITVGLGETTVTEAPPTAPANALAQLRASSTADGIRGVCAAPGLAIGRALQFKPAEIPVVAEGRGIAHESAALKHALDVVRAELERSSSSGQSREIIAAHIALLDDPELLAAARELIERGKKRRLRLAQQHARIRRYAARDG